MAKFADMLNRTWELRVTIGLVPKLRAEGFDVGKALTDGAALDVIGDPEKFGRVLFVLCEDQAAAAGVGPDEFMAGFDGPAVYRAVHALMAATADFTLPPKTSDAAKKRLSAGIDETDRRWSDRLNGSNEPDGNSPGPPGSTPPPGPSES